MSTTRKRFAVILGLKEYITGVLGTQLSSLDSHARKTFSPFILEQQDDREWGPDPLSLELLENLILGLICVKNFSRSI